MEFLKSMNAVGLLIDFVATRDIWQGEEVFLSYGLEWEATWDEYVWGWEPPPSSKTYVSAMTMLGKESLRTVKQQSTDPYPKNIMFYCHYDYTPGNKEGEYRWNDEWSTRDCARAKSSLESIERPMLTGWATTTTTRPSC